MFQPAKSSRWNYFFPDITYAIAVCYDRDHFQLKVNGEEIDHTQIRGDQHWTFQLMFNLLSTSCYSTSSFLKLKHRKKNSSLSLLLKALINLDRHFFFNIYLGNMDCRSNTTTGKGCFFNI